MSNILIFSIIGTLMAQCATAGRTPLAVKALRGYRIKSDGIEFYVSAGGCTTKDSFNLRTEGRNPVTVYIDRIRPDHCEALSLNGDPIEFSWNEIGLAAGTTFIVGDVPAVYSVPKR